VLQRKIFFLSAVLAALLCNGTAMAQETNPDCESAKQFLVEQYSRSDPQNNQKYYKIWSSPQCVEHRKNAELYVDSEIQSNERLIRSLSQDYDARLAKLPAICEPIVEKRWSESSQKFKMQQKKAELLTSCVRNQSHSLRAEYLNRLNEESEAQFVERQRLNREQIAADNRAEAERRADYERKMEEWRDAVKRCKAGQIQYCSSGS
tara:strand:+ start:1299 stop:1916 length:618 start_codon:yes stop_codon:yes gene_type:complete